MRLSFSSISLFIAFSSVAGVSLIGVALAPVAAAPPIPKAKIDFDHDVRPILSENCFACHGFDAKKRAANLRLDVPDGAYLKGASGKAAIVPHKPLESELLNRIVAAPPLQMPPASTGKHLTQKQIATLKQWIAEGGKYAQHWAFATPKRPTLPPVKNSSWVKNPLDRFVLARLEQEGLKPSPEADKRTLLRRLSLDLTGLPPAPAEVDAFVQDTRPNAYERVVDRLLASPHYGERMALQWLDLARYADTHGYHIDSHRDMWSWRDWVISSFNKNLPYDKFLLWQLAGDLLPNATLEQKIATGFSRNHPINFEGGAIPEEYLSAYIADRVDTTATAIMGLTLRCGQCHDHKYDPFTQKEYYQFYAYFNNNQEVGLDGTKGNATPFLRAITEEQTQLLDSYAKKITELEQAKKLRAVEASSAQTEWETKTAPALLNAPAISQGLAAYYSFNEDATQEAVSKQVAKGEGKIEIAAGKVQNALKLDGKSHLDSGDKGAFDRTDKASYGAWVFPTAGGPQTVLSRMEGANGTRGWDLYLGDGRLYVHLIHTWDSNALRVNTKATIPMNQWTHVFATYDGSSKAKGVKIYFNGKAQDLDTSHDTLTQTIATPKPMLIGRRDVGAIFTGLIDEVRFYKRELSAEEVLQLVTLDAIRPSLAVTPEKRTAEQKTSLAQYYLENHDDAYRKLSAEQEGFKKRREEMDKSIPTTMVMQDNPADKMRSTFILARGEYDQPGEKVTPGTLSALTPLPANAPPNRLGLAQWLIAPNHPLTARVAVNHFWQQVFGVGIVKTAEDFGVQGERPSHPELMDWLATEFVRSGWDVKRLQRLIVTSATYRQSSKVTPALLAKDPENRLLARGSRYRLQAEFVRDIALSHSGLLTKKIGGPSVRPYHPAGLWEEIAFGGEFSAQAYVQDKGESLYRRGMYTFWKRTCPPPSLQTFDAPEREFCMVRRSVTNTPLQALILMNDPTYVEAARNFAERILKEGGTTVAQRLNFAYRVALSRSVKPKEAPILSKILNTQLTRFRKFPKEAESLLQIGESARDTKLDATELAAWTLVASLILNLDEAITKG